MPALLPDGTTTDLSVSPAITQRVAELGLDPEAEVAKDLAAEDRIVAEREVEASVRGSKDS
jgi:hypothetical protein